MDLVITVTNQILAEMLVKTITTSPYSTVVGVVVVMTTELMLNTLKTETAHVTWEMVNSMVPDGEMPSSRMIFM